MSDNEVEISRMRGEVIGLEKAAAKIMSEAARKLADHRDSEAILLRNVSDLVTAMADVRRSEDGWVVSGAEQSDTARPIIADAAVRSGRPVLRGTRFLVSQVLAELADGESIATISEQYDLDECLIVEALRDLAVTLDGAKND